MWCSVRRHYCRCHDFGKRCDEIEHEPEPIRVRGVLFRDEDDAYEAQVQSEVDGD